MVRRGKTLSLLAWAAAGALALTGCSGGGSTGDGDSGDGGSGGGGSGGGSSFTFDTTTVGGDGGSVSSLTFIPDAGGTGGTGDSGGGSSGGMGGGSPFSDGPQFLFLVTDPGDSPGGGLGDGNIFDDTGNPNGGSSDRVVATPEPVTALSLGVALSALGLRLTGRRSRRRD